MTARGSIADAGAVRLAVFVDGQNSYMGARRAFCGDRSPAWCGQVHPDLLGQHLCSRATVRRALVAVRIYRGMPSKARDAKGYGAAQRQIAAWERGSLVDVWTRPLSYAPDGTAREKGVDTKLAVDLVLMAQRDEFDVAVLVSGDTDFAPALEAVAEIKQTVAACEVAAWASSRVRQPRSPMISGEQVRLHVLGEHDYRMLKDTTDYGRRTRRR